MFVSAVPIWKFQRAVQSSVAPFATYGVLERNDVAQGTERLRQGMDGCTYLFGEPMGAAIALQAMTVTQHGAAARAAGSMFDSRVLGWFRSHQTPAS
jgi:hypothetical protein